jgi:hypothetical protein
MQPHEPGRKLIGMSQGVKLPGAKLLKNWLFRLPSPMSVVYHGSTHGNKTHPKSNYPKWMQVKAKKSMKKSQRNSLASELRLML